MKNHELIDFLEKSETSDVRTILRRAAFIIQEKGHYDRQIDNVKKQQELT